MNYNVALWTTNYYNKPNNRRKMLGGVNKFDKLIVEFNASFRGQTNFLVSVI